VVWAVAVGLQLLTELRGPLTLVVVVVAALLLVLFRVLVVPVVLVW
jgi:hypothetical protein